MTRETKVGVAVIAVAILLIVALNVAQSFGSQPEWTCYGTYRLKTC